MPSVHRLEKEHWVQDFSGHLKAAQAAVLTEYKGINVEKLTMLRRELRKQKIGFQVIKNTLAVRAISGTSFEVLKDDFTGPTALAYTATDPVVMAKALVDFAKDEGKLVIRAGVLGGKRMTKEEVKALATVPSREVLLARLCGSLQAPYAGVVYALSGVLRKLVYALDAVRRKKEEQGS
ncbi:MAG TPA: 50S ribosomal protein L10 [Bdellovibrionota bacterium]|nr:50S ribosomal protein L10 [Bdellovibrionota bacterium]